MRLNISTACATTAPSYCTIYYYNYYNYYIIIIIIIWKGYFGVNPILSFSSFESKKSVVVDVVIEPNIFT